MIMLFSETLLDNEDDLGIQKFNCIVHCKCPQIRSSGVAICQRSNDTTNIVTAHMDYTLGEISTMNVNATPVDNLCVVSCTMENGQTIILAVLYISLNQRGNQII